MLFQPTLSLRIVFWGPSKWFVWWSAEVVVVFFLFASFSQEGRCRLLLIGTGISCPMINCAMNIIHRQKEQWFCFPVTFMPEVEISSQKGQDRDQDQLFREARLSPFQEELAGKKQHLFPCGSIFIQVLFHCSIFVQPYPPRAWFTLGTMSVMQENPTQCFFN